MSDELFLILLSFLRVDECSTSCNRLCWCIIRIRHILSTSTMYCVNDAKTTFHRNKNLTCFECQNISLPISEMKRKLYYSDFHLHSHFGVFNFQSAHFPWKISMNSKFHIFVRPKNSLQTPKCHDHKLLHFILSLLVSVIASFSQLLAISIFELDIEESNKHVDLKPECHTMNFNWGDWYLTSQWWRFNHVTSSSSSLVSLKRI
jgi:uncharacterized membrane protein